jgi:hypothetical protein
MLTTLTPYWGRPEILKVWLQAVRAASIPDVHHILLLVGKNDQELRPPEDNPWIRFIRCEGGEVEIPSIGYFHDIGARLADTEWIMKMDVDAIPHVDFFRHLLPHLQTAKPREWFNIGMFYMKECNCGVLTGLNYVRYCTVVRSIRNYSASTYLMPGGSNFVCRREEYLRLGGCDRRFKGWGWEDYQQMYALEAHQLGRDPLPGQLDIGNVTQRCRDGIARPKAKAIFQLDVGLSLFHHFHSCKPQSGYKTGAISERNRKILLEYIYERRRCFSPQVQEPRDARQPDRL